MLCWFVPCFRSPIVVEVSKPTELQPSAAAVMSPPSAVASGPPSLAAATKGASGLVAYDYSDVRASVLLVIQFLDRMKSAVDDWECE
jgi:hypothetical protein